MCEEVRFDLIERMHVTLSIDASGRITEINDFTKWNGSDSEACVF